MSSVIQQLVGEDGAKFDITVELSRRTIAELFAALLLIAFIAVSLNIIATKVIK